MLSLEPFSRISVSCLSILALKLSIQSTWYLHARVDPCDSLHAALFRAVCMSLIVSYGAQLALGQSNARGGKHMQTSRCRAGV